VVSGGANDDTIFGGGGDDSIFGGPGDDVIDGQDGHNVLSGEGGKDVFVAQTDPSDQHTGDLIDGAFAGGQDDQVTNIVVVNATPQSDTLLLSEPDVSLTASADAPANGRLSGDASFALSVNGIGPTTVTLLKSDTILNQSVEDLVGEIN